MVTLPVIAIDVIEELQGCAGADLVELTCSEHGTLSDAVDAHDAARMNLLRRAANLHDVRHHDGPVERKGWV